MIIDETRQRAAPRKVGCRSLWDVFIVNNDGALFASPTTHPKEVLDGVVLDGKKMPLFFEVLQNPSLEKPGEIFDVGRRNLLMRTVGVRGPQKPIDVTAAKA